MIEAVENDPSPPSWEKEMIKILGEAVDEFIKVYGLAELFYDHTVDELLWGYTDPLLTFLKKFPIPHNPITTDRFNLSVSQPPPLTNLSPSLVPNFLPPSFFWRLKLGFEANYAK